MLGEMRQAGFVLVGMVRMSGLDNGHGGQHLRDKDSVCEGNMQPNQRTSCRLTDRRKVSPDQKKGTPDFIPDQNVHFCSMVAPVYYAHPTATIDEGAVVGAGSRIWHYTHLMPTCIVGEQCILGQNVFIDNQVRVGNRVKIQNNVSIYNGVEIEDDVFLGPSMVFTNVINPRSFIERKHEFRKTLVQKGATIGANATILCGHVIGAFAMIGAGAVITTDIPPFALVTGNPGKQIGWVSESGSRLVFDPQGFARCPDTSQLYQLIDKTLHQLA